MSNDQPQRQGDEAALREMARRVVQAGTLPNRRPDGAWGGFGDGAQCTVCSTPVKQDELELEIEFAPNGESSARHAYHLHVRCFAAWEFERDHCARSPHATPAGD